MAVTIQGIATHYARRNLNGDRFARGAFDRSLQAFADGKARVMFMDSHRWLDSSRIVGSVRQLRSNRTSLRFVAEMAETSLASELASLVRGRHLTGISIGFKVDEYSLSDDGRNISRATLKEVSLVPFPADPAARVTAISSDA